MIGLIISLVLGAAYIVIMALLRLVGGYLGYTAYGNAVILNVAWLFLARFGSDVYSFKLWYPSIVQGGFKNFLIVTAILLVIVAVINRFPKIRLCYFISSSVTTACMIALFVLAASEKEPTVGYAVFIAIFSLITVGLQLSAAESQGIDDSGSVISRIFAALMLIPTPFLVAFIFMDTVRREAVMPFKLMVAAVVAGVCAIMYFVVDTIKDNRVVC